MHPCGGRMPGFWPWNEMKWNMLLRLARLSWVAHKESVRELGSWSSLFHTQKEIFNLHETQAHMVVVLAQMEHRFHFCFFFIIIRIPNWSWVRSCVCSLRPAAAGFASPISGPSHAPSLKNEKNLWMCAGSHIHSRIVKFPARPLAGTYPSLCGWLAVSLLPNVSNSNFLDARVHPRPSHPEDFIPLLASCVNDCLIDLGQFFCFRACICVPACFDGRLGEVWSVRQMLSHKQLKSPPRHPTSQSRSPNLFDLKIYLYPARKERRRNIGDLKRIIKKIGGRNLQARYWIKKFWGNFEKFFKIKNSFSRKFLSLFQNYEFFWRFFGQLSMNQCLVRNFFQNSFQLIHSLMFLHLSLFEGLSGD